MIQWTNTSLADRTLYLAQSLLFSPVYALAYLPLLLMKSYQEKHIRTLLPYIRGGHATFFSLDAFLKKALCAVAIFADPLLPIALSMILTACLFPKYDK